MKAKRKPAKLSPTEASLLATAINAGLASRDGIFPTRLRLDWDSLQIFEMRPAAWDDDNADILKLLEPALKQLRAARK